MSTVVATHTSVLFSMAPGPGQLVEVRRRQWIVSDVDAAILDAYIELNHDFDLTKRGDRYDVAAGARSEVLKRLSALNRQRYEEEQAAAHAARPRTLKGRAKTTPIGQGNPALVDAPGAEPKSTQSNAAAPAKKALRRSGR